MATRALTFVGLSGSAREGSYNTQLLEALRELLPEEVNYIVRGDLAQLPFYNQDLELDPPEPVVELRELVGNADGVIVASPEYNGSFTAVIKNAIEWLSRPYGVGALEQKPVAVIGASPGVFGTIRAQTHLRSVFHSTNSPVVAKPEVFVTTAHTKFDGDGLLTDLVTRDLASQLMEGLIALVPENSSAQQEEIAA